MSVYMRMTYSWFDKISGQKSKKMASLKENKRWNEKPTIPYESTKVADAQNHESHL
jgi:hypothetical protein